MEKKTKKGLFAIGYVENRGTYVEDLQKLTTEEVSVESLNDSVKDENLEYYNGFGYDKFPDGSKVTEESALYILFETPYKMKDGEQIYGCFQKSGKTFKGVEWGIKKEFIQAIREQKNRFTMGSMCFDMWEDGLKFLEDIAKNTIPEIWQYKNKTSAINYPILKSYIENILNRLIKENERGIEDKLVFNDDDTYVMFNTNLLDKYFHDVIIISKVKKTRGGITLSNPFVSKNASERRKMKFGKDVPLKPQFFEDINEVIFQTEWEIDRDFDKFTHIIEDRNDRFPEEYHKEETDVIARKLDGAIKFAVELAQRNYKLIVPMYRPQNDSIQLLMPIYLKGVYAKQPDFALVLTPDRKTKMYIPETILPLDAAYQNARLIAMPEVSWLNPDLINNLMYDLSE